MRQDYLIDNALAYFTTYFTPKTMKLSVEQAKELNLTADFEGLLPEDIMISNKDEEENGSIR
jgi:hypothetical protein